MLTEETVIDQRELREDGTLQVRRATYIVRDGVRIMGPTYHRVAYVPGADLTHEDPKVQRTAASEWTPEVVAAYRAAEAARKIKERGGPPA